MLASTYYCIILSYSGGGGSDYISMGYDTVNLTASGNLCSLGVDGKTWTGTNAGDMCFYVNAGGAGGTAKDDNRIPVLLGVSSVDLTTVIPVCGDIDGNLLIKSI